MRKGRILIEESPSKLLEDYNYCRLEQVVLHICKLDQDQVFWENADQNKLQLSNGRTDISSKLKKFPGWKQFRLGSQNKQLDMQKMDLHESFDEKSLLNFLRATLAFVQVVFLVFLRFPLYVNIILDIEYIKIYSKYL